MFSPLERPLTVFDKAWVKRTRFSNDRCEQLLVVAMRPATARERIDKHPARHSALSFQDWERHFIQGRHYFCRPFIMSSRDCGATNLPDRLSLDRMVERSIQIVNPTGVREKRPQEIKKCVPQFPTSFRDSLSPNTQLTSVLLLKTSLLSMDHGVHGCLLLLSSFLFRI